MNLTDLTDAQQDAIHNAASEPAIRRGRLIVSTTGKRWACGWVHPKTAQALVKLGLFQFSGDEIRWTAAGAELAAPIVKKIEEAAALPDLTPGQTVRVYRAGNEPTHVMELVDRYKEWPAIVAPSMAPFETGTLREELGGASSEGQDRFYRVTITKGDDRDLFIDWTSRYYVRLPEEPVPGAHNKDA
jgi:hypothetical protein